MKKLNSLLLSIMCLSLTHCAVHSTATSQQTNPALPYHPKPDKAVVYLIQPRYYVDAGFISGTVSESNSYFSTRAYLKTTQGKRYYLGQLYRSTLCFYAKPGIYELELDSNQPAKPGMIKSFLTLNENKSYFKALINHDSSGVVKYRSLSPIEGKLLVRYMPPNECQDLG